MNVGHFPNATKDQTKYKIFDQQNPERDQLAKEGKCLLCKKPGHMTRDCPTRKISSSYQKVNTKSIYDVTTASLSVESDVDTSHIQVMWPPTDNRKGIIPVSQTILNAVEMTINCHTAHPWIDTCTINGDLILANFYFLNPIPTEDKDVKSLEIAIKASRSTMTKKANVVLNIQGNNISRSFYVSNLRDWNAIFGQPFRATLNVIIDVKNHKLAIQPIGKPRQQLHMLQKQSHAVSTAACSIYDYDDDISNDSSSHAPETDSEPEQAEFARYHDGSASHIQACMYCLSEQQAVSTNAAEIDQDEEKIFTESLYNSFTMSSNSEEQGYERIFTESHIHSELACDSPEEMIAQAQPQYTTLQEITDWEMKYTDYDNVQSTEEVGADSVTCNALTTLTMYDPTTACPELFPDEKPTQLSSLRYPMEIMQHRIDVIPHSHWSPRFPSTYNQFQDQITDKIKTE